VARSRVRIWDMNLMLILVLILVNGPGRGADLIFEGGRIDLAWGRSTLG